MFCGGGTFSKYYPLSPPWYPYFARKAFTPTVRFDAARARRMEEMEREEQIELAIAD